MDKPIEFDKKKLDALPIIDRENPDRKFSEKEEKHLRELCVFEFNNTEQPGVMHKFSYGNSNNKMVFNIFHGQKYVLPRFLARWIESAGVPVWSWAPDGSGRLTKKKSGYSRRFMMREAF